MRPEVSVVTGGSNGIGAEVCRQLLAEGQRVINLSDRMPAANHPRLESMVVDLVDRDATAGVAAKLAEQHTVTRFVHCAGTVRPAMLEDVALCDLDYLTELHLSCAIALIQKFLPAMRAQAFGRIVLIASRGMLGLPTRTVYGATKAAMVSLARTWSLELASFGITANVVAPGPIETELFRTFVPDPARRDEIAQGVPVKRLGTPVDVARVVRFLVDRESSFITGQAWFVCGGASVGSLSM